jgi:hypothetical protein
MPGDPTNDMKEWRPKPCKGCGSVEHRGLNAEVECLERNLAEVRAKNVALAAALDERLGTVDDFLLGLTKKSRDALEGAGIRSLADLRRQVAALGPSAHEKQQLTAKRGGD